MSTENVVLVVGAHRVSGCGAAEHWASLPSTLDCIDIEDMFAGFFARLRSNKIIP
jgi:hypothetical protein